MKNIGKKKVYHTLNTYLKILAVFSIFIVVLEAVDNFTDIPSTIKQCCTQGQSKQISLQVTCHSFQTQPSLSKEHLPC